MVVELVAGRIIARHVGQSLYTWTSVIGIVLAGITLGNLIGGRLSDRFNPRKTLSVLFLLAALACLSILGLNYVAGNLGVATSIVKEVSKEESWPLRIAVHVTLVFLLPSTALGLIGPVVAKLALDQGRATGKTVGNVYGWGALGSIVGTFVTGFYLVPAMGTMGIVFSVAAILAVVGIALAPFFTWPFLAAIFIGVQLIFNWQGVCEWKVGEGRFLVRDKPDSDVLYEDESQYSYIKIGARDGDARSLVLDNLIHAYYVKGDPKDLRYDYEKVYAAVTERFGAGREKIHTLFLGGGGYIFPRFIRACWPESSIEVAEIDPAVTRAVLTDFGLSVDDVLVSKGPFLEPAPFLREPALEVFDASDEPEDPPVSEEAGSEEPGESEDSVVSEGSGESEEPPGPDASQSGEPGATEKAVADAGSKPEAAPDANPGKEEKKPQQPIRIYHLDARNHVDDLVARKREGKDFEPCDFVYGDAFNDYSVPFHLVTREFSENVKEILRPDTGIYMINIIDIYISGKFLGAVYNTLRDVFPEVYIYATSEDGPDRRENGRDTFIVIGALKPLDLADLGARDGETAFVGSLLEGDDVNELVEKTKGMILTDDYSPVENLLEVVVCRR